MKATRRELFGLAAGGLAGLVVGCKVEPEPEPPPSPEEIEVEINGPYRIADADEYYQRHGTHVVMEPWPSWEVLDQMDRTLQRSVRKG